MKAISVWQPYANFIAAPPEALPPGTYPKNHENRARWKPTSPQYIEALKLVGQDILIHASLKYGGVASFDKAVAWAMDTVFGAEDVDDQVGLADRLSITLRVSRGRDVWTPRPHMPRGAIVAVVRLDAVVETRNGHRFSVDEDRLDSGIRCIDCNIIPTATATKSCVFANQWAVPGVGLAFSNIRRLKTPVPVKARQGWFTPSNEALTRCAVELKADQIAELA